MRGKTVMAAAALMITAPAAAQMVDIPIWSNGILGQQALRNSYDNFNEANGLKQGKSRTTRECTADPLPPADRRKMEQDYIRRARDDGQASADAWVEEQARRFHLKMVAAGVCPGLDGKNKQVADSERGVR